ncbi:hypothetical protein SEPCBS57363_005771 [Sporothrix epigloea]|uniref:Uncharacterized protein n=1 Tax=Sporothrix epigloea TaxID=1892477 RepID=A0ABP0E2X2_9PEZI
MSRQSIRNVLRSSDNALLGDMAISIKATTCANATGIITFAPTSSTELDDILDKIRSKIILLSYLNNHQRKDLYDKSKEHQLKTDPITLDVDGDIMRFHHIDMFRDIPNARAATREAVGRMTTPIDFENLPRLLEGLHRAKRHLQPADYARIARLAGERNCIYAVIECARQVQRTGFRLANSETVAEILTHIQMKAIDSDWKETETRKSLVWAELVIDLLQQPGHGRRPQTYQSRAAQAAVEGSTAAVAATPAPLPPTIPLSRDPQVLAARLHLAAVVADRFSPSGEDTDGKVLRYATELVQLWPADSKGLRTLHSPATYTDRRGEMHYLNENNKFLGVASPLLHGLDTAIRVLGSSQGDNASLTDELKVRRDALATEVNTALADVPGRRGAAIYKKIFEPDSPMA